jgi:hypothetical protein
MRTVSMDSNDEFVVFSELEESQLVIRVEYEVDEIYRKYSGPLWQVKVADLHDCYNSATQVLLTKVVRVFGGNTRCMGLYRTFFLGYRKEERAESPSKNGRQKV